MACCLFHILILGGLVALCYATNTTLSSTNLTAAELAGNLLNIIGKLPRISSGDASSTSSTIPTRSELSFSIAANTTSSAIISTLSYLASPTSLAVNDTDLPAQSSLTISTADNTVHPANTTASLSSSIIPFSTTEAEPTFNSAATLNPSSTRLTSLAPVAAVITSINPTGTAALADGIVLGAALLSFSKSAAQIGPDITKAQTKTAAEEALEAIKSKLEDAFKDRGGDDTGNPCVADKRRLRFRRRGLVDSILDAFRCAIQSVNTLSGHLSQPIPDPTVISDDLVIVGTWAEQLEEDEESDDDQKKTQSNNEETSTTSEQESTNSLPSTIATQTSATNSRNSISSTASVLSSTMMLSNATFYPGLEYAYPAITTVSATVQSAEIRIIGNALSKFYAMGSISVSTMRASPTMTPLAATSVLSLFSSASAIPISKPSCMADGSPEYKPTSWCICATSLTFAALPQTARATPEASANCNYAILPSTTINPTSVVGSVATPVPGENGVAQCVYEIVDDQENLPAGTEDYCFCAGGPDVSAASAPLLTHSGTSLSASAVTDCAYTTQPVPGWTPSVTGVSASRTVRQSSTSSSSKPTAFSSAPTCKVACTGPASGSLDVTCLCLCPGVGGNPASYSCTYDESTEAVGRPCNPDTCDSF